MDTDDCEKDRTGGWDRYTQNNRRAFIRHAALILWAKCPLWVISGPLMVDAGMSAFPSIADMLGFGVDVC
jgi:hypothetical protein